MPEDQDAADAIERCRRLLVMVRELHLLGYERLRIEPSMAPSGLYWRLVICSAANTRPEHGATVLHFDEGVNYSSAEGNAFFGWADAEVDSPRQLAEKFIARFPRLAREALGRDSPYTRWYEEMLEATGPGGLPYAYADWPCPKDRLSVFGRGRRDELELPPPSSPNS